MSQPHINPMVKPGLLSLKIQASSRVEVENLIHFLDSKYKLLNNSRKYAKIKYDAEFNYYYTKIYVYAPVNLGEEEIFYSVEG